MHRRQILGIFLLGAAAVFGCRGASSAETQATIPPTNPPIPTATASPSVTPTPTNTPTATPTIAPSPTATPRPSPTPTPKGFYVNEEGAYSLIYPVGWEILEEEGSHVMLFHAQDLASFSAVSTISDGSITFDDVVLELVNQIGPGTVVETQDTFPMRDGTIAQRAVLGASIEELDTTIHVIWVEKGMRDYLFLAWAPDYEFSRRRRDVEKMLSSVRLESSWVYGNERESTLVLLGSDPFSGQLDPARMTGSADSYAGHLYSGLVRLAPDMRIEPDLAESWEISADGTVYSFTLRPDLAFQSGKPLTAADVKYSWERAANPETGSPTVKTYLGDIVGVLDKVEGRADEISGVRVLDERTLEVELDGPKPYFLAKLTYPTTFVLDQENVEADPDTWMFEPNASGPFILEEIREEEAIIFKPNESYYEPPALDAVIYLLYLGGDNVSFFEAGEIDITGVGDSDVKVLQDPDHPLHDQLLTATSMCTSFIALNNTRPPMDDPNVRRAFALAVDKEHLNEVFNENLDLLAASILPPAMPGFSPDLPQFSYDPEAARAALAESKYQDGLPTIVISASGYGELDDPVILALMDTWRTTLGVDFEVQMVDPENFIDLVWEAEEHLTVGGWCADYPDPENFLDNLFHSDSIFNLANYQNPDLDALLEAGRTESDPADRLAIYHQAETLVLEDGAAIPLWHSVFNVLVNPRVQGYTLPPIGAPILHLLSLETAEP